MRVSLQILLLIALHFTSAAPVNIRTAYTIASTPPTKLLNPYFPPHQLRKSPTTADTDERFINTPIYPPTTIPPSKALSAQAPLTSAYLLSISHYRLSEAKSDHTPVEGTLSSKPTSALPSLRKTDAIRYWEERAQTTKAEVEEAVMSDRPASSVPKCAQMSAYQRVGQSATARAPKAYNDFIVVGIVVVFLLAVVVLELMQKVDDLTSTSRRRHGAIFLEEDDTAAYVVRMPFFLQPVPVRKHKLARAEYTDDSEAEMHEKV